MFEYMLQVVPVSLNGLDWIGYSMLAVFTALMIHGLLLALSNAFSLRELEIYSKSEIVQSAATLLMVVFLGLMISGFSAFSAKYFFGCQDDPRNPGRLYNCGTLSCGGLPQEISGSQVALDVFKCNVVEKAVTFNEIQAEAMEGAKSDYVAISQYLSILGLPIFQGSFINAWFRELESYRIIINLTTNMIIVSNALIVVLNYVSRNMLSFFLPLGLFLRSFHFTRGVGALLISIAIGFYFVFPIVYVITDPGFHKPSFEVPPNIAINNLACYPSFSGIVHNTFIEPGSSGSAGDFLSADVLRSDISLIYTLFLLHAFISFSLTFLFIRYGAMLLGGNMQDLTRFMFKVL